MIIVIQGKGKILVVGHAGFAEPGKDIVCAGITTLVENLIQSINDLTRDKIQYTIKPGVADIRYKDLSKAGKLLVDSFFLGARWISNEFPGNVRVCPEKKD